MWAVPLSLCESRPEKKNQQLTAPCSRESRLHFLRVPPPAKTPSLTLSCSTSRTKTSPESHSGVVMMPRHAMFGGGRVYSQVSRLSLSMCDPDRTVSMSISRSELRPSGMQGINSSPSDIGSTGIDSCRVMEGASPQSPAGGAQDMDVHCDFSTKVYGWKKTNMFQVELLHYSITDVEIL